MGQRGPWNGGAPANETLRRLLALSSKRTRAEAAESRAWDRLSARAKHPALKFCDDHSRLNFFSLMNAPKSARSGLEYCRALSSLQP